MASLSPRTPPKRRAKHNNSFLGCMACKRGHYKCDEVKPICGRCQQKNTLCVWPGETPSPERQRGFRHTSMETVGERISALDTELGVLDNMNSDIVPILKEHDSEAPWGDMLYSLAGRSSRVRGVLLALTAQLRLSTVATGEEPDEAMRTQAQETYENATLRWRRYLPNQAPEGFLIFATGTLLWFHLEELRGDQEAASRVLTAEFQGTNDVSEEESAALASFRATVVNILQQIREARAT